MLTPSYSDLMDVIKKDGKVDPRVASRYTIVLAAAKRARQLTEGAEPLTYAPIDRAVSIAVKELNEGKLHVKVQADIMEDRYARLIKDQHKFRATAAISSDDLQENLKDDYSTARTYKLEDEDDSAESIFDADSFTAPDEEELPPEVNEDSLEPDPVDDEDFSIYGDEEPELEENFDA